MNEKRLYEPDVDLLKELIDNVHASLLLLDPIYKDNGDEIIDFYIVHANETFAAYSGESVAEMIGRPVSIWFAGYLDNGLFEIYKEVYLNKSSKNFEFHYLQDDIDAWLDLRCKRSGDYLIVTSTDHSNLRNLQVELELTVEEMKRSNNRLEEFAFVASHDLQEPLRKINSFGSMLKSGYEEVLTGKGHEYLERMMSATQRMNTLIEDLLTFSRINSNREEEMEEVSLQNILEDVLTDLEAGIIEQDASISMDDKLPEVKGNATQIRQLFQNLLGNAMKFARADVPIEIIIEAKKVSASLMDKTFPSLLRGKQEYHQITFRDNGIGFEPEYAERIFQVFQRLHGKTEYPGSGVGLSIARSVMDSHGGHIVAEGRPQDGATFTVYFPVVSY